MSQFFDYSKYYNLLYQDKNYTEEVGYINSLVKDFQPDAKNILDIGCGTGKHASLIVQHGYKVHGIDLSSQMLEIAKQKTSGSLTFSQGDIRDFKLPQKFDVITSLFHVMSYQNTNTDVENAIKSVHAHLLAGGIFIFDCWYGPGVMLDLPSTRVKRIENDELKIIRVSQPVMDFNKSLVDVNFEVNVIDRKTSVCQTIIEHHVMRYFFKNELLLFAHSAGFEPLAIYGWMEKKEPIKGTWYATLVWRKI